MDLIHILHATLRFRDVGLFDITLAVAPGERFAIFGAPGSGKSALLSLIAGRLHPEEGEVSVCGEAPEPFSSRIGLTDQWGIAKRTTPRQYLLSNLAAHHVPTSQRPARLAE